MGLDGPTAAACYAPFDEGGALKAGKCDAMQQMLMPDAGGATAADDFPEDLNGIPLANLTNTAMDVKVEPYFGFAPASVSSLHNNGSSHNGCMQLNGSHHSNNGFLSNAPSTSSDSGPMDRPVSSNRLVIRDLFDDDSSPEQNVPPPPRPQLGQDGRPIGPDGRPLEGQTWMEQVRASGAGEQRPLVPVRTPPVVPPPPYSYQTPPLPRQRWLESLYPPGTFSPNYFRNGALPFPPPRAALLPMSGMLPRYIPVVLRPPGGKMPAQTQIFPVSQWVMGPNGPIPILPNGMALPLQPFMGPPPCGAPPQAGPSCPGGAKQQQAGAVGTPAGAQATAPKPKKESVKARKAREAAEKERQLQLQQQQQQQQMLQQRQAEMAMAAAMGMQPGRSPCDPSAAQQFPGQQPFGAPPPQMQMGQQPGTMQQQQMMQQHMFQQQQQQLFKVPGRSPSSMKRASLPPPSVHSQQQPQSSGAGLAPMPDQRIHHCGQCSACNCELNEQRRGIQCTAISQGCNRVFHWECAELTIDAFLEFCKDPRLEWICRDCFAHKGRSCVFAV